MVGNSAYLGWNGRYLRNDYGAYVFEDGTKTNKMNPAYDDSQTYVPREERDEWVVVGLLGQIPITKGQPVAASWIKMNDVSDTVEMYFVK